MATSEQIIRRLGKLQSTLLTSGLQKDNQPLYQVINQLIQAIIDSSVSIEEVSAVAGGSSPSNGTYLTVGDELIPLPQSSQLVAGSNVSFDTSVFGQLQIDVTIPANPFIEWSVLANGDPVTPELIFAGGDVIMVHTP